MMNIISSGHLAKSRNGCADAFANIVYENLEKQLIFPCTIKIEKYNTVALEIQKGFLGFDIIINQTPIYSEW